MQNDVFTVIPNTMFDVEVICLGLNGVLVSVVVGKCTFSGRVFSENQITAYIMGCEEGCKTLNGAQGLNYDYDESKAIFAAVRLYAESRGMCVDSACVLNNWPVFMGLINDGHT